MSYVLFIFIFSYVPVLFIYSIILFGFKYLEFHLVMENKYNENNYFGTIKCMMHKVLIIVVAGVFYVIDHGETHLSRLGTTKINSNI